jgi:hypothetical protein
MNELHKITAELVIKAELFKCWLLPTAMEWQDCLER